MIFLAPCIPGLQQLVAAELRREPFGPVSIERVEEGLVVFAAPAAPKALGALGYVNNVFALLETATMAGEHGIDAFMRALAARRTWHEALRRCGEAHERSFRIVLSDENRLVAGDARAIRALGATVQTVTGLEWSPRAADCELWILRRRGGDVFLLKRLARRRRTERDLKRGELRPELALLLCRLSEPAAGDVFLDPFAGSGAIGFARARSPYNMIFMVDRVPALVAAIKADLKAGRIAAERKGCPIIVRAGDARHLDRIDDGFVDKVVTDPPWGEFEQGLADLPGFYASVLAELVRVTKPGGLIVMLLGRNDATRRLERMAAADLVREAAFDILVSGRKAVVVKWRKPLPRSA